MDGTDIELNSVFSLLQLWWAGERENGKFLPFLRVSTHDTHPMKGLFHEENNKQTRVRAGTCGNPLAQPLNKVDSISVPLVLRPK